MKFSILTILLFLQLHINCFAQDSTKTQSLNEVIVSANFQETEVRKAARNIAIITGKDIENAPVKTLDGILQYALNVDVRTRGPMGAQADISIRGGNYDQTLILLDGVKLNDPQTGHHSLNLPISMDMIERIEVLQGGGSRIYGPSAFSGVINIITKKSQPTQLNIGLSAGEFGLKKMNFGGTFKYKGWNTSIGAEKIVSDGFAKNTDFNRKNLFLRSSIDLYKSTQISVEFGTFSNKFGASNYYSPKFYNQSEKVSSQVLVAQFAQNIGENFSAKITASWRKHNDVYDFDNYGKDKPAFINFHQTDVYDLSWINKYQSTMGTTSVGFEYRSEGVISNRLGDLLAEPLAIKNSENDFNQTLFYTKGKVRKNKSAYFEQFKQWDKATLAIGTLVNFNNQFGTNWYPGIDFSYAVNTHSNIYASINRSLRFPTFTEMYLVGSTVKGDPNLKPEDAWSFEVGTKRNTDQSQIILSAFYKHSNSAIDKIKRPNITVPTMENIGDMNTRGIELAYLLKINALIGNEKTVLQSIKINYAFINADKKEDNYQSFYTLNYLKHKSSVGLNWRIAKNLSLDTWYTYKNRAGQYQWDNATPAVNYAPINLLDARLNWQQKYFRIFVDGTNLLNKTYFEFGFVEQPKRWLSAGAVIIIK